MRLGRPGHYQGLRYLGITLVILGLLPIPLPLFDFHNVRHHDGAGEVCEYHDHLLVWHPDASLAEDLAIWHCHWVLTTLDLSDSSGDGDGPAVHAHIPDPPSVNCCDAPRASAPVESGPGEWSAPLFHTPLAVLAALDLCTPPPFHPPPPTSQAAPHASLSVQLQRLVC